MSKSTLVTQATLDTAISTVRDRGAGTSLPSSGLLRGDVYLHTALGLLMYTGSGWRQLAEPAAASAAALTAVSTTYAALLYNGLKVRRSDTGDLAEWDGLQWIVPGQWTDVLNNPTYSGAVPVGPTPTNIAGGVAPAVTLPLGRTLEAELVIPKIVMPASTTVYLRLLDGAAVLDGAELSTSAVSLYEAVRLRGYVSGDGASHTVLAQAWAVAGSGSATLSASATAGAPVRFRQREF
jgi:hypothetical protein